MLISNAFPDVTANELPESDVNDPVLGIACVNDAEGVHLTYNSCPMVIPETTDIVVAPERFAFTNLFVTGKLANDVTELAPV